MKATSIIIAVLLMLMVSMIGSAQPNPVPAPIVKEVVKKELVESQYGTLGDLVGIGDRVFIETYADGSTEKVFERTTLALAKATIIEVGGGSTTFWQTEGQNVNVNIRVQGVNVPSAKKYSCTTTSTGTNTCTKHKFEIFDVQGSSAYYYVPSTSPLMAPLPSSLNSNPSVLATLQVKGQNAGEIHPYLKEYVELNDGSWMGGSTTKSSEYVLTIIWTQSTQAGTATPATTPIAVPTIVITNPNYVAPTLKTILINVVDSKTSYPIDGTAVITSGGSTLGTAPLAITVQSDATKILYVKNTGYFTGVVTVAGTDASPFTVKLNPIPVAATPAPTVAPTVAPTTVVTPAPGEPTAAPTTAPVTTTAAPVVAPTTSQQQETQQITQQLETQIATSTNPDEIAALKAELERLKTQPAVPTPTPSTPGFEGIFAIAGLFAVAFLVMRQRKGE